MISLEEEIKCSCAPEFKDGYKFNSAIFDIFGDCIYTPQDYVSFGFGIFSLALFMVSLLPQLYKNYKRKSVDGISPAMFYIWLLGDIASVAGALLTNQIISVLIVGVFFCFADVFAVFQCLYYRKFRRDKNVDEETEVLLGYDGVERERLNGISWPFFALFGICMAIKNEYSLTDDSPECKSEIPQHLQILGSILAWCSGLLYFCSRMPQIKKNFELKSVNGLAIKMFIIKLSANVSYGISIILRTPAINKKFFQNVLPYLIGSIGTTFFDIIIMFQTLIYRKK
jgi:uncharacterized protein with PQ loop repeat